MRAPVSTLLTLTFLLIGFGLLQMGNALQGTLLAVRGGLEGFDATSIGLLMSGYFAGMCLGSFGAGKLIEQAGHIRVFAALASLGSASALGHLLVIDPVAWIALRTLTGFCFAGLIIVVESWLNASASPDSRGRILSIYSICSMGAGIVGQLLFSTATPGTFTLFVLVSLLMSVALVPISLSRASAPIPEGKQEAPSIKRLWHFSPFGAVAMLLKGATFGAFFGLAPIYAQRVGLSLSQIGLLMAAFSLGGVLLQYPLGLLSDRVNRRLLAILLSGVSAAICVAIGLAGALSFSLTLVAFALVGAAILPNTSIIVAHVNDRAPATALIAVAGGLVLMQGIGAVLGPILAGGAMESMGPSGLMFLLAVIQAGIAAFGLVRIYLVEGVAQDDKAVFSPAPIVPVMAQLEMSVYEDAVLEAEESGATEIGEDEVVRTAAE